MGRIKDSLQSNIVGAWDFRRKSLLDRSTAGLDLSVVGTGNRWANSRFGSTYTGDGGASGSYLTNSVSNFRSADEVGSIEMFFRAASGFGPFSSTVSGSNNNWMLVQVDGSFKVNYFLFTTSTQVDITSNSALKEGDYVHCVITSNGSRFKMYINGVDDGFTVDGGADNGDWFADIGGARDNVTIGALVRAATTGSAVPPIGFVRVYDKELSSQEVSQLSDEAFTSAHIGTLPKRNFQLPENIGGNEPNLVGGWNMDIDGDTVSDVLTGGNDLTKVGNTLSTSGVFGKAEQFDGSTGYLKKSVADYRSGDSAGSIEAWVKINSTGSLQTIFASTDQGSTTRIFMFRVETNRKIAIARQNGGSGTTITSTNALSTGAWNHCVVTSNGSRYKIYINGVEETKITSLGSDDGGWFNQVSFRDNITIGASEYSSKNYYFNGAIDSVAVYSAELTPEQVLANYNKGARKPIYRNTFEDAPVTLGTSSGDLNDFMIESGTWKISEDSTKQKWLENVTAGIVYTPLEQAYGTWEFDVFKGGGANDTVVLFSSTKIGNAFTTGLNGYYFLINSSENTGLFKTVNGSPSGLGFSAAGYTVINTKYTIRITRSSAGAFTCYIKGGAFTNWTLVDVTGGSGTNPVTDTTTTTSKFMCLDFDAGDKISNIRTYEGVLNPLAN